MLSHFPPTSGQIVPSYSSSNKLNWDPHMEYTSLRAIRKKVYISSTLETLLV